MKSFRNLSIPTKIFIGWGIAISAGLYGFILSRRHITTRRYESMKARERMHRELTDLPAEHTPKSLWW